MRFLGCKIPWRRNQLHTPVPWAPLVAHIIKNPPTMWATWVPSLGWEDPLEKGKATHSSILAWRILSEHIFSSVYNMSICVNLIRK